MASTNQSPFYKQVEAKFLAAHTNEEKLKWLEEMIKECPKHKSSEKMLANLKTRYIKLKEKIEGIKKAGKSSKKQGIKKEDMQAVIVGLTNSGKSSLLNILTNTSPEIAFYELTTKKPLVGMMPYAGMQIQIIEIPALKSEYYDKGLVNSADTILILVNNLEEITEIEKEISSNKGKKIVVFNNKFNLEIRKLEATLKSRKYNFCIINTKTEDVDELKEKIFQSFDKIRVFTKEPGKPKSDRPIILHPNSNVKNVAEKILKGFSNLVKETKIWGPSSKFPGQKVGLAHILKDLDVVEFKTR
ncbi:MAG: GTPase [Nanoarchaeota archaeon]